MTEETVDKSVARIQKMEDIFVTLQKLFFAEVDIFERDAGAKSMLEQLVYYYTKGEWLEDYALDEAGRLPRDLKRGVLSQDGVDNFLREVNRAKEK